MNLKQKYRIPYALVVLLCSIGFTSSSTRLEPNVAVLNTKRIVYQAGEKITLQFDIKTPVTAQLFLHASYGRTLLESETGNFNIPDFMASKKGTIDYVLYQDSTVLLTGSILVKANLTTPVQLESYVGPPSIIAGGKDYTMHVIVPTDIFDNPLPDSTALKLKHQFLNTEKEEDSYSKDMMGWKNIFSYKQSGRLLISSVVGKTSSKEFSIEVFPSLAVDFGINSKRKHAYADGNQIAEFNTSILKDDYGNIVSDGTLVTFNIKNKKGVILQTQGSTVNGQATGKILHPDHVDSWMVSAYIPGIAKSNVLNLEYKPVLSDFDVRFDKNNREIIVGPLISFMNQLIPDGAIVNLTIEKGDTTIETKIKSSSKGIVVFRLKEGFYPSGIYRLTIEGLGVQKKFLQIQLK